MYPVHQLTALGIHAEKAIGVERKHLTFKRIHQKHSQIDIYY